MWAYAVAARGTASFGLGSRNSFWCDPAYADGTIIVISDQDHDACGYNYASNTKHFFGRVFGPGMSLFIRNGHSELRTFQDVSFKLSRRDPSTSARDDRPSARALSRATQSIHSAP